MKKIMDVIILKRPKKDGVTVTVQMLGFLFDLLFKSFKWTYYLSENPYV